jgi:hypothetical protein
MNFYFEVQIIIKSVDKINYTCQLAQYLRNMGQEMPASNQIRDSLSAIVIQLADVKVIYYSSCYIRIIFSRDDLIYHIHWSVII